MTIKVGNTYSPDPVYGFQVGYSIADLDTQLGQAATAALTAIVADTTSAALNIGAKSIVFTVDCPAAPTQTFDVSVFQVNGGDQLFIKYVGLKNGDQKYVGNIEGFDFDGFPIKIRVDNRSGNSPITVTLKKTS